MKVGGTSEFLNHLPGLFKRPKFNDVKYLGIIRDAEKNIDNPQQSANNAYRSIFNILIKHQKIKKILGYKFNQKIKNKWIHNSMSIGIYIITKPGCGYGMLEDLCLEVYESRKVITCIDQFLYCVNQDMSFFKTPSKNKILAFLASQKEAHRSIAVAADKKIWTIEDTPFIKLKLFLEGFK